MTLSSWSSKTHCSVSSSSSWSIWFTLAKWYECLYIFTDVNELLTQFKNWLNVTLTNFHLKLHLTQPFSNSLIVPQATSQHLQGLPPDLAIIFTDHSTMLFSCYKPIENETLESEVSNLKDQCLLPNDYLSQGKVSLVNWLSINSWPTLKSYSAPLIGQYTLN